jgi:hypothetical protein
VVVILACCLFLAAYTFLCWYSGGSWTCIFLISSAGILPGWPVIIIIIIIITVGAFFRFSKVRSLG